jgi:hypothetical protein
MGFDPFFSSANKKYYIPNPDHAVLKAKVEAMSREERDAWTDRVSYGSATPLEKQVLKSIRFIWNTRASCRRRYLAERIACDLTTVARQQHCTVLHGHSSTGGKRGASQDRGIKSQTHRMGPAHHFNHVYDKGKRPKQ